MNGVWQDLKFALRLFTRRPTLLLLAAAALALGIGANSAIFSVLNGLFFRSLPFPEPGQLVQLQQDQRGELSPAFGEGKYLYWRENQRVFEALAAYDLGLQGYNLALGDRPFFVQGVRVSRDFFATFGVKPLRGRIFSPEEDLPGGPPAVLLSHGLWQRQLHGDPDVLDRPVRINGKPHTVVGILPQGFEYPAGAELLVPLALDPASQEQARYLQLTGRLREGLGLERARNAMDEVNQRYLAQFTGPQEERVSIRSLQEHLYGQHRPTLLLLLLAVGVVLLIACANAANLQLARAAGRRREIAIRSSQGARPWRLARQLLTESLVMAMLSAVAGLILAFVLLRLFLARVPSELAARLPEIGIDATVLLFTLGLALLTGILAGVAPAVRAGRLDINDVIKDSSAAAGSGGRSAHRTQNALVTVEVALALVLLIGAALLIGSFGALLRIDPGFEPAGVQAFKVLVPAERYGEPAQLEILGRELVERVEGLPGVSDAALVNTLPLEMGPQMTFLIPGRYEEATGEGTGTGEYRAVGEGFFGVLEISLVRGRLFDGRDHAASPPVLILNETAAERYFPGEEALGQRLHVGQPDMGALADPEPREIVGIVEDVRETGLDQEPPAILYVPLTQMPQRLTSMLLQFGPLALAVRAQADPMTLFQPVQEALWSRDPDLLLVSASPLTSLLEGTIAAPRFQMALLTGLAVLAFVLSTLGIYGVLAYLVRQRRREIGIRMALGGLASDIRRLVVGQGLRPVLLGLGLGILAALWASRLLSGFVYGISPRDPLIFAGVVLFVFAVALVAAYLPARRASRVDPVEVLRPEG